MIRWASGNAIWYEQTNDLKSSWIRELRVRNYKSDAKKNTSGLTEFSIRRTV